jgi:hypothetical protein
MTVLEGHHRQVMTVLEGHHRLAVLRERGFDIDALPREVLSREANTEPD